MLITNNDILNTMGTKIKSARKSKKYTQEFLAENINISTDLLRNIENGRNIGSVTTILNICNFLQISPNSLFEDLLEFKEETLDSTVVSLLNSLSKKDKETVKNIVHHINEKY